MNDFPRHRLSLLLTAMFTCSFIPASQPVAVETAGPGNVPAAMADALKGLGPAGWSAPSQDLPAPAAMPQAVAFQTPSANPSQISADRLKKLIATTLAFNEQTALSRRMTLITGLTHGDEQLIVKESLHKTDTASHLFSVPIDSIDRLVLVVMEPNTIRWVVTDRSGRLIAAASVQRGQQPVLLSDTEARALYAAESVIWTATADQINP